MLESIEEVGIEKGIEIGIEQGIEQGVEQGIEQGRFQALEETAINMLRSGLTNEQIVQFTGLDSRTIKEIAKKLKSGKTPDYKAGH